MVQYFLDDSPPTRFYFPRSGSPIVSPAYGSQWDIVGVGAERITTLTTKQDTNLASEVGTEYAETEAVPVNILHKQYISAGSIAAGTIEGRTFSSVIRGGSGQATAGHPYYQVVLRVVSNDGTVERGVLFNGVTDGWNTTPGALGERFTTANLSRIIPAGTPLNTLTVQANDRLVIEIGHRADNTITTNVTGYFQLGDDIATADAPLETDLAVSIVPWLELDFDIFGTSGSHPSGPLLAETGTALILE